MATNVEKQNAEQEAISAAVLEFQDIKYELSLYVDDGLMDLAQRMDKAIEVLAQAANTAGLRGR